MLMLFGMSLYLIIALICGLMLVVIAFLGADFGGHDMDMGGVDHDMGGGGDGSSGVEHFQGGHGDFSGAHLSPLSLPLVLAFGTAFGSFGAMFDSMNWGNVWTPTAAAGLSLAISGILYFALDKFFVQTQATSTVRYSTLIGKDASVVIPIKPGVQGQILVITEERGRTLMTAVSSEEIPTDSPVVIEGYSGGSVKVSKKKL
jgi:membrane protein implicated in regulation of membrane protease activity